MIRLRLGGLAALAVALFGAAAFAVCNDVPVRAAGPVSFPSPPPLPPPKPVIENFFGKTVSDPYRYFENMSDPVVESFFKDQNTYSRAVLADLGAPRQQLFNRIKQLDNAGVTVSRVFRVGPYYFYEKLKPGENLEKLYVRKAGSTSERVLVDPEKLGSAGKHFTINYYLPSLDGTYVEYGISEGGSEASVIHVVETATAQTLPDSIDRAYFIGATSWLPDGKSFYYVRFRQLRPGEPETMKETRAVAYLHVLGRNPDQDTPIFGYGVDPNVTFAPTDFPILVYSPVSDYTLGVVAHGVKNEVAIYAAPSSTLASSRIPWKRVVSDENEVTGFDLKRSTIFLVTHHDAPTFKVVATSLAQPDFAQARTLVSSGRSVIEQAQVAADGLYILSRYGGFGRLSKVALAADGMPGSARGIHVPYSGTINTLITDSRVPGATFGLTGWTHSLLYYAVDPRGKITDTHLKPLSPVDASTYTSKEVEARSQDGTLVPLSLVFRKGIARDGSHPTFLEGYSAYGINLEPGFSTTRIAWMERGGIYATCHARGSGWYGEAWHRAGMIATKNHTWEDYIACAQWLVENKYTSPQHLAGSGTSAGGILIGRAITTRPDLFAAAIDEVGASNTLRAEFSANGPPNIPEFGSVTDQTGFAALYAMDAYQHVVDGTKYPAVMLVTGYNDPRVASWELAKFAARLQTASISGRPILLRVDYDAGHGFLAGSRSQNEDLLTDEYAFLLWQLGDPAFASIPTNVRAVSATK